MYVVSMVAGMRITLPSGTEAEIAGDSSTMGLVIAPDIFGLRPLYDDMVARLASDWSMMVCAVEPFPGFDLGPDVEPPDSAAVPNLDDDVTSPTSKPPRTPRAVPRRTARLLHGRHVLLQGGPQRPVRADRQLLRDDPPPRDWAGRARANRSHTSPRVSRSGCWRSSASSTTTRRPMTSVALDASGVTVVRYPDAEHGFAHAPRPPIAPPTPRTPSSEPTPG